MKKVALLMMSVLMVFGLAACGGDTNNGGASDTDKTPMDVNKVWDEIVAGSGELPEMADLGAEGLTAFYNINEADLKQYVGKYMPINVIEEDYFIAEVVEGKMDTVKAQVEARKAALEDQWKRYLPEQYEKVQNSKIIVEGNYILFVVAENPQIAVDAFIKAAK